MSGRLEKVASTQGVVRARVVALSYIMSDSNKYKDSAEKDVASIEVGDSPTEVESKILGLGGLSGLPDEQADDAEDAEAASAES